MRLRTFTALAAAAASLAAAPAALAHTSTIGNASGASDRTAMQLHMLLSAQLHY